MEIYDIKNVFDKFAKGKQVSVCFDKSCVSKIEFIYDQGVALESCHVEYNKALVDIEGDISYVEISPHRQAVSKDFANDLKSDSFGVKQINI